MSTALAKNGVNEPGEGPFNMLPKVIADSPSLEHTLCLPPGALARFGKGGITDATVSPDGNLIAVASRIGVWLYNAHTSDFSSLIAGEAIGVVAAVAFSADNTQLATGDWDSKIVLWDVNTEQQAATFHVPFSKNHIKLIAFSPNGKYLAIGFQKAGVILWHLPSGKRHLILSKTINVNAIAFSTDSQIVATSIRDASTLCSSKDDEGAVALWQVDTGELHETYRSEHAGSIAFTSNGQLLEARSRGAEVTVWQVDTQENVANLSLPGYVHLVRGLARGRFLCLGGGVFSIWKDKKQEVFLDHPREGEGWLVAFDPETKHLASLDRHENLRFWDIETGLKIQTLERVTKYGIDRPMCFRGNALVYSSRKHWLVISMHRAYDGTVLLWNGKTLATFRTEASLPEMPLVSASVSLDGTRLATGGWDKTVTLWDVKTEKPIRYMTGHTGEIKALAFSPNGKQLVSGGAHTWEYHEDEDGSTFRPGGSYTVMVIDGKSYYFYFGKESHTDTTAKVWDVETGKHIRTLENGGLVNLIAFSGNGVHLVTASGKRVNLWNTKTWQKLATFDTVQIESLAFSPDGIFLAIGGIWPEHSIQILDVTTLSLVIEFSGHKSDVESIAFSPDGALLASASYDGTILLWNLKPYLPHGTSGCD